MDGKNLLALAKKAKDQAYAPYSGFQVGAALLTTGGKIFLGCNVENASYGLTNCAERTAIFSAVAAGFRDFRMMAIYADTVNYIFPCGACRQVFMEFNPDMEIIMGNINDDYCLKKAKELLPAAFVGESWLKAKEDADDRI